jgi:hypothetical protein
MAAIEKAGAPVPAFRSEGPAYTWHGSREPPYIDDWTPISVRSGIPRESFELWERRVCARGPWQPYVPAAGMDLGARWWEHPEYHRVCAEGLPEPRGAP